MKLWLPGALFGLLACATLGATNPPADSLIVLTVDAAFLETGMPLYAEIERQAGALRAQAAADRARQIDLAVELRRSESLTALPEAIAQVALGAKADLVIDRKVAKRIGQTPVRDVTAEVQRILEVQFQTQVLETDP